MIEAPALYPGLSVLENLYINQLLYCGQKDIDHANQTLESVGLQDQKQKKAKHLSLGMKQRLSLATALLHHPKILILDEPANGLDPMGMIAFRKLLQKLNADHNISIIISSHILNELEHIATDYSFLHKGKLLKEISSSDISKSADSLEQYYEQIMEGHL